MRVVAVEDLAHGAPIEAVLFPDEHPEQGLIHWWSGYASEPLESHITPDVIAAQWPTWKLHEMELPDDWEEGYLRAVDGLVEFVYGKPPSDGRPPPRS